MQLRAGAAFAEKLGGAQQRLLQQGGQVHIGVQPFGIAALDLGHVQHLVHQAAQAFAFGDHQAQELLALGDVHVGLVAHQFRQRADARQRCAQFVRDAAHEVVLQLVHALQLFVQRAQRRSLFDDAQHVGHFQRLFFHHRRHHHPRRRAADGAGQQRFGALHELRVCIRRGRMRGQLRLRLLDAHEAPHQCHQIGHLGAAAPEHTFGCGVFKHVDEEQRLAGFGGARRPGQRHHDKEAAVGQQAPEERVAQVVQAAQAEQRLGPQQRQPKRAMLQEARVHPAALGDGRQHQRIDPEQRTGGQPRQRTVARAALPVHATQQCGRKLRHGSKADQPDADQRIGFACDAEVQPAQQQQHHDDGAADEEQHARQVPALRRFAAQQERQHQVVADHGADGDGLDDDHAGGRRQAADKGRQRQHRHAGRQRQAEHKGFGVRRLRPEIEQPTQRNRQHEEVDQQQVRRKGPGRAPDVAFGHVLHHHDLKLPRQQQHAQSRQHQERQPLVKRERLGRIGVQQAADFGRCQRSGK